MLKGIKPAFWLANALEACERLAYFGIRAILPLMMVSTTSGGLGLSYTQLGIIYGVWALLQCLIPMVSGGFSESFGYKKTLIVAYVINICGYVMMANILRLSELLALFSDGMMSVPKVNFVLMLISGCTIGVGTAIFKPPVQGTVAKSLNEKNSGFGFGLFYWVVNVGGFLAPLCASALRGSSETPTWHYVFFSAALVTTVNLILTLCFFKEPERSEKEKAKHAKDSMASVFKGTIRTLWNDKPMLCFLLIVSGFWLMFMQLWDLLPNFLNEWVDRRGVGEALLSGAMALDGTSAETLKKAMEPGGMGMDALGWATKFVLKFLEDGALKPEMIINIDSAAIILFVLPLSAIFSRFRMMTSLVLGMVISVVGFVLSGMTMSGGIACLAIFIFAIGEIICSPKFSEYIGMTAPEDKKAIYMGYSNIPFAIGWALGNFLSGPLYQGFSSKEMLAKKFLEEHHGLHHESLKGLDLDGAMARLQDVQGGIDVFQANELLWNAYNPWIVWIILGSIGVASMVGMIVFYFKSGMHARDVADAKDAKDAKDEKDEKDAVVSEPEASNTEEEMEKEASVGEGVEPSDSVEKAASKADLVVEEERELEKTE